MDNAIQFEGGVKLLQHRLRQGLKPLVRLEVRKWRKFHAVTLKARLEPADGWHTVAMSTVPIPSNYSREWDATALELWKDLNLVYGKEYRHGGLTQHLSHLMFIFEVEVTEVRLKRDLAP